MKRQLQLFAVIFLLAAFPFIKSSGNNLTVANVTYSLGNGTVTFDLRWENGWRNTNVSPQNWDAAWVFVKWRSCDETNSAFIHGTVSTNTADHTFNGTGGGGSTTYEPTQRDGTVGIDASPNNTGVMLRNASDPITGTFNARVTLKLTNFPASGSYDVRVFAMEMVFIPQSPYLLGDGGYVALVQNISTNSFTTASGAKFPYLISSENAQDVWETATLICPSGNCNLQAGFQKGYKAFYIQKYEISQGQYADFLSANNYVAQLAHYPSDSTRLVVTLTTGYQTNRNTLYITGTVPSQYAATRSDRAANYLSWADFTAYLSWAALRPLTELEFEKACRGTQVSIPFERAWGNTVATIPAVADISVSPENGTETINTVNANVHACSSPLSPLQWTSGDEVGRANGGLGGPLRSGIFVKSTNSTRQQSGTSFYGCADMSGNVAEYYVSALAGTSGSVSQNGITLGTGSLDATGNTGNMTDWPSYSTAYPNNNVIRRGGDFQQAASSGNNNTQLNVSNRQGGAPGRAIADFCLCTPTQIVNLRDAYTGGRGGR